MKHPLLESIAAVEISTVIVDEIVDEIFIPWEAYRSIYGLSRASLSQVAPALHSRYLQLRRQLELAYCLLLTDPKSSFYKRLLVKEVKLDLPILSEANSGWEALSSRLPEPIPHRHSRVQLNQLLSEPSFLDVLRQLHKQKIALDQRDRALQNSAPLKATAYAQTALQLNGKIINRYAQALLDRSDRDLLLKMHEQSTAAGEQQWRHLVKFILSLTIRA